MMQRYADTTDSNTTYQRDLAHSILAEMGREQAMEFCLENGWHGVAASIERLAEIRLQ